MKNKVLKKIMKEECNINKQNKYKKAITLITLLVTIIVILILTGAIIFTIRRSGTIYSANETLLKNDLQSIKESYREKYNDLLFDYNGKKENIPKEELEDVIPEEYKPDFVILPEGPAYVGEDPEKKEIAEEMGYIIGYPKDKIEIEYVNLNPVEDKIIVNFGIKDTELEVKNIKYYISEDGINWIDVSSNEFTHEFTNLKEFTEYQIKIVVTDENDDQTESKIYIAKTKMRDFEPGTLTMTKDNANGEVYISGEWTNQSVYIKVNEDPEPTIKTTYEVTGANVVPKGTSDDSKLDNSGISKIKVTTEKYGVVKTREYEVKIDKDKPVINSLVVNNTNPTNQNVIITGSAIDKLSGIVEFQFSTDGNLDANSENWEKISQTTNDISKNKVITENGTYYFYVKDAAGNITKKEIIIDNIDKIAPVFESMNVTSPETGIYKAGQEVTIVATFSENITGYAPILKIKFGNSDERTINTGKISGKTITYTYTIQDEDNGLLVSTVYNGSVTDLVGNNLNVENMPLGGNKITADTTPPTKIAPSLTSNTNSITATFRQTDSLSGINNATRKYAIKEENSSIWGEWIISDTASYTFTGLTMNTVYQVKTMVSDNVGNSSESEISTISTINITKPTLSAPTDWANGSVEVTITYPNIPGTTKQYSTDGINWTDTTETTQIVEVTDNNTTVYARIIDSTNQTSGNATYTVTCIDKDLPTVEIGTNGGNYTMNIGSSTITVSTFLSAKDTGGSGLDLLQYQLSTSQTIPADDDPNWKNFTNGATITENVPGGIYYIYTKVTDKAGNRAISIQKSNTYTTQYQIIYNSNGGIGEPTEQIKVHGEVLKLSDVVPTRNGYDFIGWSKDKDATVAEYTPGQTFIENTPTMLYAIWSINTYSIEYDANGGINPPESQTKTYGQSIVLSVDKPTREGHTFLGWNTDKDAKIVEYAPGAEFLKNENTTLYAVWSVDTYPVKYDANGGTGEPVEQSKIYGEDLTLRAEQPTKEGHVFLGWGTTNTSVLVEYAPGGKYVVNEPLTLYAIWSVDTYTVEYDANGGLNAPESQTKTYGDDLVISPEIPIREGYTFVGWNVDKSATIGQYSAGGKYGANENVKLYAIWRINTFSVQYDTTGATEDIEEQIKTYGKELTLSSIVPTKEGYTFVGWNTDRTAKTAEYQPGDIYNIDESTMLYAIWSIKSYTIKYDANGGTLAPASQIKKYHEDVTLSLEEPTKEGHIFVGWNTNKSATTAEYTPGAIYTTDAELVLYAIWRAETYSVRFSPNYGNGGPDPQTKIYGVDLTLSTEIPTRGGYTFVGWHTDKNATTAEYAPGDKYTANTGAMLYAIWSRIKYTVSYDANGGSPSPSSQIKEHGQLMRITSEIPKRPGYSFIGWNRDKNATTSEYSASGIYNEDRNITLYAIWDVGVATVFYDPNGGETVPDPQTKIFGQDLTLNSMIPTREGYTFVGWNTNKNATTSEYAPGAKYSLEEDLILYAIWKANSYTITFDPNGGTTPNPSTITKECGTEIGTLPTTTREGYMFLGWCLDPTGKGLIESTTKMPTKNTTVYAVWQEGPQVTILENPSDYTTIEGNEFGFGIGVQTFGKTTFQWYYNTTNSNVGGTLIPGANSISYSATATEAMNGRYYYCVVTSVLEVNGFTSTATSSAAKLTVLPAYYSVTKGGKNYYSNTLQMADSYAVSGAGDTDGGTITVLRDVPNDNYSAITKTVKLNMNGKTVNIEGITTYADNITFTIVGGGSLISPSSLLIINEHNSTINISNVSLAIKDTQGVTVYNASSGTINLTNVTATATSESRVLCNAGSGTLTFNSGTLTTTHIGVKNEGSGTLNINGGTINAGNIGINTGKGVLNVTNGTFSTTVGNVFINDGLGTVRINGNNINLSTTSIAAIVYNNNISGKIEIIGATLNMKGEEAAVINAGNCTMNGAKITAKTNSYINFSGTANITNTTMTSDSNITISCDNGNVTVNSGEYINNTSNVVTVLSGTFIANGGTFKSVNKNMTLINGNSATSIIKGGTFIGGRLVSKDSSTSQVPEGWWTHTNGTYVPAIANIGILSMSAGTINAEGMALSNLGGTSTVTGGTITSSDIALSVNEGTVNVGNSSTAISTTNPIFTGTTGVYNKDGKLNFYNGIFRGTERAYYGTINGRRSGATLTQGTSGGYKTAYYR